MRYLKIFESFRSTWICKKCGIENYIINADGSIDVDGDVDLGQWSNPYRSGVSFTIQGRLDLKLRNVSGHFTCDRINLISLEGCPVSVGGGFYCGDNLLVNLEGCPLSVGGHFHCGGNKLTSLEGCPKEVGYGFNCEKNNLSGFEGYSGEGNHFSCNGNIVYNVWMLFEDKDKIEYFNEFDMIRNNGTEIILDRLNSFLQDIGKPIVKKVEGYICI